MSYLETEAKILSYLKNLNPIYKKAFIWAFALINLAFLFHTVSFMFGDHDWNYIRSANYWSEGSYEGRPLHFVLQSIFFDGHVLPILNNLFSFAFLTLGGLVLARYWQIPVTVLNYTLFTVFVGVLPYTLVWLFYTKDTLINLSLPLIAVSGLMLADKAVSLKRPLLHILAILLFVFAFSSYAVIINFLGVCFLGSILISYVYNNEALMSLIKQKIPAVLDMLVAVVLFKLMLLSLPITESYNTEIISLDYLPQKLIQTLRVMFTQFITPIPFMEYKYKIVLLVLSVYALCLVLVKGQYKKSLPVLILTIAILFASKLTFLIAEERGQILAEMENFAFVPRLDFYGLGYIYALAVACILSFNDGKWRKFGVIAIAIIAFMSIVRDTYAQKVWKLGFDAEMKAHERIVSRLEQHPDFIKGRKYRLLQLGSLSLRQNFYRKDNREQTSLDLLSTSFTPEFMSRIVYNFYYPEDLFYANATIEDLSPAGITYLRYGAKVWPKHNSIFIDGDVVIIVLTEEGLERALR